MNAARNIQAIRTLILALSILSALFIISCAKDKKEPEDPGSTTPVPTTPPYFSWTVSGGQTTVADSSFCYVSSNAVDAFRGGNSNSIEIRLSAFTTGTYVINSVSGNQLDYQLGTKVYTGSNGTVNITAATSSKITGNFNCSLSGGTITSISGTFADVPKR
jgi:hypothetical protein